MRLPIPPAWRTIPSPWSAAMAGFCQKPIWSFLPAGRVSALLRTVGRRTGGRLHCKRYFFLGTCPAGGSWGFLAPLAAPRKAQCSLLMPEGSEGPQDPACPAQSSAPDSWCCLLQKGFPSYVFCQWSCKVATELPACYQVMSIQVVFLDKEGTALAVWETPLSAFWKAGYGIFLIPLQGRSFKDQ